MKSLSALTRSTSRILVDNSPTILTVIGATGTLVTAYLTGKATFKAAELIREVESRAGTAEDGWPVIKERGKLVWKLYIPAASTAFFTVGAIVCANRIGMRRAAALAAAVSISERAFEEYREKIAQKLGKAKEQAARDEIAQDRVTNNPVGLREVILTSGGSVLCYDAYTGRYFLSDVESLKKAQNDLNYRILHDYYASLSDFYDLIGLPPTSMSGEVGWNSDKMLELEFSTVLSEDNRPCIVIDLKVVPIRNFYRVN
jgi:hypothetical protein